MSFICASTAAYFFLPMVKRATMPASAAESAPANAATAPPPGAAVPAAVASMKALGTIDLASPGQRFAQFVFQNLIALEHIELQIPLRRIDQRVLRRQADEFGLGDGAAITRGLAADRFHHARDGRLAEVGQVHRDLRLTLDQEADRLSRSAGRRSNVASLWRSCRRLRHRSVLR